MLLLLFNKLMQVFIFIIFDSLCLLSQAGLTSKGATRLVLEQEAELIVCRHISSIYACGGDFALFYLDICEYSHFDGSLCYASAFLMLKLIQVMRKMH